MRIGKNQRKALRAIADDSVCNQITPRQFGTLCDALKAKGLLVSGPKGWALTPAGHAALRT